MRNIFLFTILASGISSLAMTPNSIEAAQTVEMRSFMQKYIASPVKAGWHHGCVRPFNWVTRRTELKKEIEGKNKTISDLQAQTTKKAGEYEAKLNVEIENAKIEERSLIKAEITKQISEIQVVMEDKINDKIASIQSELEIQTEKKIQQISESLETSLKNQQKLQSQANFEANVLLFATSVPYIYNIAKIACNVIKIQLKKRVAIVINVPAPVDFNNPPAPAAQNAPAPVAQNLLIPVAQDAPAPVDFTNHNNFERANLNQAKSARVSDNVRYNTNGLNSNHQRRNSSSSEMSFRPNYLDNQNCATAPSPSESSTVEEFNFTPNAEMAKFDYQLI